ncbi:hypothetical protein FE773_07435 [Caminibacter mediatlanticus TB-2]|uniref:PD-(D/E)XK endonuclease-like domain-containing protein n=1 Tax=Caminibacter mediatlanticus TB-2 TaxID=391592 RepID=A0ABX5V9R1_9BACT|nr:PD-(D/E)XK nuclease family protein [Caminibacter mediatlanticus]QCT95027.1 hypothetical protein FE773_07435 [Caminibacter mediatlanticus TB-2]
MNLKVLTTSREIREYLNSFDSTQIIDKVMSIGEFLDKSIIVDGKKFIDDNLRKVYLYKAIKDVDIEKLGINREFMSFFKSSDFILGFFNEVYLERVNLDEVDLADTYIEYNDHLAILKEIYKNYKKLLEDDGFIDKIVIDDFRINKNFLSQFEKIELEVLGYLTKFDLEILKRISEFINIEVSFRVTQYNQNLIKKMFGDSFDKEGDYIIDFASKNVLDFKDLPKKGEIEISYFSDRINQVNFIIASIEEFINEGLRPERIAVILPDEEFGEYLKLFKDKEFNINFAFGDSFRKSNFFIKLKALFEYITTKDKVAYEKIKDIYEEFEKLNNNKEILEFLKNLLSNKEKIIVDEEFYKIEKLLPYIQEDKEKFLHFLIERFKNLSFDDVDGGKVTAMGVLESRGLNFDGVIVVDFNEGVVPNISDTDYFLNNSIRKKTSLPTREDKESLQKNYYYNLFLNSKKIKIAYIKNEENNPSRFLYELGLNEGENRDFYYSEVLYRFSNPKKRFSYDGREFEVKNLTPTSFYDLLVCKRRYYFKYILQIKNEIEEKDNFGTIFHNSIEKVIKEGFNSSDEYFEKLMREILKEKDKKEIFEIRSKWEDKIKKFCEIDYIRAKNYKKVEKFDKYGKKLGDFILNARFDRIDEEFVYDYKTGSKENNIDKDTLQRLFYNYIFEKPAIFYYIKEDNIEDKENNLSPQEAKKELEKRLKNIEFKVEMTDDIKNCKYCEYRFVCGV